MKEWDMWAVMSYGDRVISVKRTRKGCVDEAMRLLFSDSERFTEERSNLWRTMKKKGFRCARVTVIEGHEAMTDDKRIAEIAAAIRLLKKD